ncbi:MAG: hypothetical protein WCG78_00550 [Candidatus Omnitrophota bacterium]
MTATLISLAVAIPPSYASKTEIKVTGTVPSFGTYSVKGAVNFKIAKPGRFEIGKVTVYGTYNGPYPWIMRVYTDNTNYMPVAGSLATVSRAGLISDDGQFTVPLQINCPNLGADWAYIPDINDTGFKPYQASKEPGVATHTECLIMGIDPRNADWVSGPDRKLFTGDDNPLGDTTMTTPFDIRFAADFDDKTVRGSYTSNIYVELVPAP